MRNRFMGLILAALAFSSALLAHPPLRQAQGGEQGRTAARPGAAAEVKPTPRLPDGKPDMSGVWTVRSDTRFFGQRTPEMARNRDGSPQEVPVTIAEQALTPAAAQKYKAQIQAGKVRTIERDILDPMILACAPPGPTRLVQMGRPFEMIQIPGRVMIRYEFDHWVRDVWLDGRGHPKDQPSTWMGHSIGRWDGDTLVVDTVGMNDLTWLDSPGHPHSEDLHVVERYRRVNNNTLEVEFLFEDPQVYTKPLPGNKFTFRLLPNTEIMEFVTCDDRIRILLETPPCKISEAWEFEAYCNRQGAPKKEAQETGAPRKGY